MTRQTPHPTRRQHNAIVAALPACALLLCLVSCGPFAQAEPAAPAESAAKSSASQTTIRVGTWNLEHLGSRSKFQNRPDAPPDRTPAEWRQLASFLAALKVDVMALQEIASDAALRRLLSHLGDDYRFALGTTGIYGETRISVGFLWNRRRVRLLHCGEMSGFPSKVGGLSVFHRKPVNATFQTILPDGSRGFDFRAITVHLKASRGRKNERKRSAETKVLADYLRKLTATAGEDQDILVLGDFNHSYGAPACKVFSKDDVVRYAAPASASQRSPTIVWFDEPIDHLALSQNIRAKVRPGSLRVHNQRVDFKLEKAALKASKAAWRQVYSDHFPVTLEFVAGPDDDPDARLVKAGKTLSVGKPKDQ